LDCDPTGALQVIFKSIGNAKVQKNNAIGIGISKTGIEKLKIPKVIKPAQKQMWI
jgi:hypothetical protein